MKPAKAWVPEAHSNKYEDERVWTEFIESIQADALESAASLGERNDPTWVRLGWAEAIRALKPKEVGK